MDLARRHFIAGIASVAGVSALDGFGFLGASAGARSVARATDDNPSRRLEDYPHIIDAIPSKDMHRHFPLIVDACAHPGTDYLFKVPFIIELEVAKIWRESRFEWDAISAAGAAGLQQLMAATAREYGLTVIESAEFVKLNECIAEYRQVRSRAGATRQKLYQLAESGTGVMQVQIIDTMNQLRAELRELDDQRAGAYQDLTLARGAYQEKIRSMSVDQRKKTDSRFVPELHVPAGVKHLVKGILECKKFFGGPVEMNVWRGIAAYNSGLARVKTWGGLPFIEETVHFTRNVVSDLTRALEMKYAYSVGDPALIAETRMRIRLKEPYFMYVVKVGDNFFRILREHIMERYDLTYSEALRYIRDEHGNTVNPDDMSIIYPDQQFRIYFPCTL
ncbi:MAG: lytic transglycosylase domain-containing protein [Syntrophales bacterium]|nr:lytic transglycosylase domain-containing protein [Syntrophales bacterium]